MARIVFDLDGTLVDSIPDIHALMCRVIAPLDLPPLDLPTARSFVGSGVAVGIQRLRAHYDLPDSQQEPLLAALLEGYDTAVALTRPYPGVVTTLDTLRAAGHRLGICTNKPLSPTQHLLTHLDLTGYFDTVIAGDSLPARKPDPTPLTRAFDDLGHGDQVYVGDSEVDAETAVRADVPFLLFTEGYRKTPVADLPHKAHFSNWADMPALIPT